MKTNYWKRIQLQTRKKKDKYDTERIYDESLSNTDKYTFFGTLCVGFAEKYIEAFANYLRANNLQFTLLVSVPQFIGWTMQLFTYKFLQLFRSRKRMNIIITLLQSAVWIPILLLAFSRSRHVMWPYLVFVTVYFCLVLVENPSWNSWMMDIVRMEKRGAFLANRTMLINAVAFISFITGGFMLAKFSKANNTAFGFAMLFSAAILFSLLGVKH